MLLCWMLYKPQRNQSQNVSMNASLPPVDDKPTLYNLKAVFEGEDPRNVTSYLYTPNGTRYTVCTISLCNRKPLQKRS